MVPLWASAVVQMHISTTLTALAALIAASVANPAPFVPYTGPCSSTNCGATGLNCQAMHLLCVPWPHTDPALRKGCTCSYG